MVPIVLFFLCVCVGIMADGSHLLETRFAHCFVVDGAVSQLPVQRREFDMSRLQLLNANADKSSLSTDETKAVTSHLVANVPQASRGAK